MLDRHTPYALWAIKNGIFQDTEFFSAVVNLKYFQAMGSFMITVGEDMEAVFEIPGK